MAYYLRAGGLSPETLDAPPVDNTIEPARIYVYPRCLNLSGDAFRRADW